MDLQTESSDFPIPPSKPLTIAEELKLASETEQNYLNGFKRLGIGETQNEGEKRVVQDEKTGFNWTVEKELIEKGVTKWTCQPIPKKSRGETKPRLLIFYSHTLGSETVKPEKAKNGLFARLEISPLSGDKSPKIIWDQEAGILLDGSSRKPLRERQKAFKKAAEASFWPSDFSRSRRKVVGGVAAVGAMAGLIASSVACGQDGKILPSSPESTPQLGELPQYLPEEVQQGGIHDYDGEARKIIEEVESEYSIKMISPNIFLYEDKDRTPFENIPYTVDELRILKEGLKIVPVQFREPLFGRWFLMIKSSGSTGGSGGRHFLWSLGNQVFHDIQFYLPGDFDVHGTKDPPDNSNARRMKSDLLHEFVHAYIDTQSDLVQKWADRTGWKLIDGSWNYDRDFGGPHYFLEHKPGNFCSPGEDIAFSIELYCLDPNLLDDNRKALIEELFEDQGISFQMIP
ncbi:MAG TPA: hypothetical protein VMW29_01790 [Candidatus Bathyarchaeia archaeon]|nr:hypothetical protein [Candidatus Bathyarchaeia archaeon]